jgi:hypothetical protein
MEVTAVVLFKDAFAYYSVIQETETIFSAHLFSYSGESECMPPAFIRAKISEERIESNIDDIALIEDILRAVKLEQARKLTVQSFPHEAEHFLPAMNRWF